MDSVSEAKLDDSSTIISDAVTPRTGSSDDQDRTEQMGSADRQSWTTILSRIVHFWSEPDPDGRFANLKVKPIAAYPEGYPQYAAFIDTDSNFQIFRRFGVLRNRVILHRQFELAQLEKRLEELDEADENSHDPRHRYRLASIKYDNEQNDSERKELIDTIDEKLEHYDALLGRERESAAMDRPTSRNHQNLVNYVNNKRSIAKEEVELLNRIDDFVVVGKEQDSPFHVMLENFLHKYSPTWIQPAFVSRMQRDKARGSEDAGIELFSKARVNVLIRATVTIITVALLMIPVCVLFKMNFSDKIKVTFVLVFVFVFPVAISLFARPRNHELFAGTAAYTAVLVVFLTNFSGNPDGTKS